MEVILMVSSLISEFMKHAVSTFATLVIHCITDKPGFALLFLGWFVLMTIELGRHRK